MNDRVAYDRYDRRWFGYDYMNETMWHPEGADTDMADLDSHELELMFGPIAWPESESVE